MHRVFWGSKRLCLANMFENFPFFMENHAFSQIPTLHIGEVDGWSESVSNVIRYFLSVRNFDRAP